MQWTAVGDQIRRLAANLTVRQKFLVAGGVVVVAAALVLFVRYQRNRDFSVLYSGLGAEDAAAMLARLKEAGTEYRLSEDGTTIRVRSAQVAEWRLQLASAGIPKTGRIGFELFDRNSFGATEFTEHINYQRALEGELERSVMTLAEVEHARVHITPAKDSVFTDQRRPAKASILLKLRPSTQLSKKNVAAVTHLVASGVEGLTPDNVSVLDVRGNLLTKPAGAEGSEEILNQTLLAYKRTLEVDLLTKLNATLEPLLGPDRFRVAVSVDCDLSSSEQSEESYDPARSVMTTSQRSEDTAGAGQPAGVPGVASNLPRPTSRPGSLGQGMTRRSESINYQSSRLIRRTRLPQGNVRRISASVLLDHRVRFEGSGAQARRVVEPPGPERIKATRDLVAGAIGFQADRGDVIIVEAMAFEQTLSWKPLPGGAGSQGTITAPWGDPERVGFAAGAVVLLLVLAGGSALVVRKRRRRRKLVVTEVAVEQPVVVSAAEATPGVEGESKLAPALEQAGPSVEQRLERELAGRLAMRGKEQEHQTKAILDELASNVKAPSHATKKAEILTHHLIDQAKKDPASIAQILRTWIHEGDS
jgi:flagellar M-ring protein FliF